ncbi:MAG: phenylalanine--tRNA ligase subunit beta [Simkaniaceae bacterium]|nr:phenylalanine--tRNA ligase subunit beta [Simkaniaceae bacterium]
MRVLTSWLKEYISFDLSINDLSNLLTLGGLEVEGVENAHFSFKDVKIAKVQQVTPHPDAQRLHIAKVFDGTELHTVVCGAANCREGLIVAFAPIGAILQGPDAKPFKISKARLRGVESYGMLCSEEELKLSSQPSDGIMELPSDAPIGEHLARYLYDPILEVSLTPNLGHAASMIGIARELSAQLNTPYQLPKRAIEKTTASDALSKVFIHVDDAQDCSQYRMRMIENIKVEPSPSWLKSRLEQSGIKSINNIVDALNYVMLELGQPMHAFDFDKLEHKKISVKKNPSETKLKTLDGQERRIPAGTLLIYDGETPIAVAGVIGGDDSAISDQTTTVIIESAHFNPSEIRRSTKKIGTHSDSSYRFERGIDPCGVQRALDQTVALICELTGATPSKNTLAIEKTAFKPHSIHFRISEIERIIGIQLSQNEVIALFKRLECQIKTSHNESLTITPPSYRNDIRHEIDLLEEVCRLFGFNNIKREECRFSLSSIGHHPRFLLERKIKAKLMQEGLQEFLTCNLISPKLAHVGLDQTLKKENLISVLHAKSIDQSILRASFLPGLLETLKHNQNRQIFDIQAFEMGALHFHENDNYFEKHALAILLSGKRRPYHFSDKPMDVDFFDLKGHVENLFIGLCLSNIDFKRSHFYAFHPGRQCEIILDNETIGVLGEVHPNECRKLSLDPKKRVLYAQIDLDKLLQLDLDSTTFESIPQYPGSQRDLTLTLSDNISIHALYDKIAQGNSPLLKNIELIDVFKDEQKVGLGKQNMTLRFTYRDDTGTLEMKQVDEEHAKIIQNLASI